MNANLERGDRGIFGGTILLTFYGTRMFITTSTKDDYRTIHRASSNQFTYSQPISLRSNLIISSLLYFGLLRGLFPRGFPSKILLCISHCTHAFYVSHQSYPPLFDHSNNIWWRIQITKFFIKLLAFSRNFLSFRSKYSTPHLFIKRNKQFAFQRILILWFLNQFANFDDYDTCVLSGDFSHFHNCEMTGFALDRSSSQTRHFRDNFKTFYNRTSNT
jgi:hypothetical protein